ncbi:CPBP family intramembrane glutamic endopeptidase [Novosphingobium sp. TH158]|uniref:CPBP family intramembrane glutamic endopeptidase n=1 Tax=Novosphingobium sp. TH158 TaxID=2067455 RepID=UPI000C7E7EBD|nr:type II CAAX endopeptidase family protein [Novosphingobium sp. TH158]
MTMPQIDHVQPQGASRSIWRAIWDFPLVAMIVALGLLAGVIVGVGKLLSGMPAVASPAVAMLVQTITAVGLVFFVTKFMIARLGERKHDDLPLAPALGDLGRGVALGFGLMALVVGIAAVLGAYRITGWGSNEDAVRILLQAGLFAAFVEEVIFRGVLFRWIEEMLGSWAALAITSALFGIAHLGNANATVFSSVAIALEAGILLGACYMLTRSLWLVIGVHMGWNVTQGYLFAVPVSGHPVRGLVESELSGPELLSGGAFGLEASVIALCVASLAGLWLLRKAIAQGQLRRPMWVKPGR